MHVHELVISNERKSLDAKLLSALILRNIEVHGAIHCASATKIRHVMSMLRLLLFFDLLHTWATYGYSGANALRNSSVTISGAGISFVSRPEALYDTKQDHPTIPATCSLNRCSGDAMVFAKEGKVKTGWRKREVYELKHIFTRLWWMCISIQAWKDSDPAWQSILLLRSQAVCPPYLRLPPHTVFFSEAPQRGNPSSCTRFGSGDLGKFSSSARIFRILSLRKWFSCSWLGDRQRRRLPCLSSSSWRGFLLHAHEWWSDFPLTVSLPLCSYSRRNLWCAWSLCDIPSVSCEEGSVLGSLWHHIWHRWDGDVLCPGRGGGTLVWRYTSHSCHK